MTYVAVSLEINKDKDSLDRTANLMQDKYHENFYSHKRAGFIYKKKL